MSNPVNIIKCKNILTSTSKLLGLTLIGLLSGCEAILCSSMVNCFDPLGRAPHAPDIAYLELKTPNYMDAHVFLVDKYYGKGHISTSITSKIIKTHTPGKLADGWSPPVPSQKAPQYTNFDGLSKLPRQLSVEWTSLPENKAYRATIYLNHGIHRQIKSVVETSCLQNGEPIRRKRNIITLELAPQGKIRGWLSGSCLGALEIGKNQGELILQREVTEHLNYSLLTYDRGPMDRYIQAHGIPYSSW